MVLHKNRVIKSWAKEFLRYQLISEQEIEIYLTQLKKNLF